MHFILALIAFLNVFTYSYYKKIKCEIHLQEIHYFYTKPQYKLNHMIKNVILKQDKFYLFERS